jgi:hypothetical protein
MMGELKYFLGFQVKQLQEGTFLSQTKYTQDILSKFGMKDAKPIKTPMGTNGHLDLDEGGKSVDQKVYRSMIGSCRRTSQVIGPTCTCHCLKDLRQLCMCTKQLNMICPSAPGTPDKRLTTKIAGLSKHKLHTNICSRNKILYCKMISYYNKFTLYNYRSDYKRK